MMKLLRDIYYQVKPGIPRTRQISLRRQIVLRRRKRFRNKWPIDNGANKPPKGWPGWPGGMKFALILTHDVETEEGIKKCRHLMDLEENLGFRSSFNIVPERYKVFRELRQEITSRGFEVGVHGLKHDGKLFRSKNIFRERAIRINEYLKDWSSVGFRSPAMHHNLEWIRALDVEYDSSTFDTDPFEPFSDGVGTIFPFWVSGNGVKKGYVELPYTLPQDFTLFILMGEKTTKSWKQKLEWIVNAGGMALLDTHPDYMNFGQTKLGLEEYPAAYYGDFLRHVKENYEGIFWHTLPREVAVFCKSVMDPNCIGKLLGEGSDITNFNKI